MNTGAEAVETAIKAARKWAYEVKGVPEGKAEILVCADNFHGRTTAIVGFSSEPEYRDGFGPFTPGFRLLPYGDADGGRGRDHPEHRRPSWSSRSRARRRSSFRPTATCARCARSATRNNVAADRRRDPAGLGRTGKLFASSTRASRPDVVISARRSPAASTRSRRVLADDDGHGRVPARRPRLDLRRQPARRRGRPRGAARAGRREAGERSAELGAYFMAGLRQIRSPTSRRCAARACGSASSCTARPAAPATSARRCSDEGCSCKETHDHVIRFAPPLVIEKEDRLGARPHRRCTTLTP